MNMKRLSSRILVLLLALVIAFVLTGCVSVEQRFLNGFKKIQDAKACHLLIGLSLDAAGSTVPLKLDMDMTQSGQNYLMKGNVSLSTSGSGAGIPYEIYLKDGSVYMGTSLINGSESSGTAKYLRMTTAEALGLTGGMGVSPQMMGPFYNALKNVDMKNVHFEFGQDTKTVSGKQVQLDKATLTPTPEESKKIISALVGNALDNVVSVDSLSFTLWLNQSDISRVECAIKASSVSGTAANTGLLPQGPYTITIGIDIVQLGETLPVSFPDFNDQNTLNMEQYVQQVTQDFIDTLGPSPVPSATTV